MSRTKCGKICGGGARARLGPVALRMWAQARHLRYYIPATENAVAARIEGGSAEVNALGYSLDVPYVSTAQMPTG